MLGTFQPSFSAPLPVALAPSLALLASASPLRGHIENVQGKMARKCGLAHLLLFQALLYSAAL